MVQGRTVPLRGPQVFLDSSLRNPALGLGTTGQVLKPRFQAGSAAMASDLHRFTQEQRGLAQMP